LEFFSAMSIGSEPVKETRDPLRVSRQESHSCDARVGR